VFFVNWEGYEWLASSFILGDKLRDSGLLFTHFLAHLCHHHFSNWKSPTYNYGDRM